MSFRHVARLSLAPLLVGIAGGIAAFVLAGIASAKGFAGGALLVAAATLVSSGFYARGQGRRAGPVLIRLAIASALKVLIVLGGAVFAMNIAATGELSAAGFTAGVIAGLLSTLFNTAIGSTGSTGASTS